MKGFGWYIYRYSLWDGSLEDLADAIVATGAEWVAPRMVHWIWEDSVNYPYTGNFVRIAKDRGLKVAGWSYNVLMNAVNTRIGVKEAEKIAQVIEKYDLDGWIVNAEKELKIGSIPWKGWRTRTSTIKTEATIFWKRLRSLVPRPFEIGMTSYRYPHYHRRFPFWEMSNPAYVDYLQPQVYWEQDFRDNAGYSQMFSTVKAHEDFGLDRIPIRPIAPSYPRGSWVPTAVQMSGFAQACRELEFDGAGIYTFEHASENVRLSSEALFSFLGDNSHTEPEEPLEPPPDGLARLWREAVARGWELG